MTLACCLFLYRTYFVWRRTDLNGVWFNENLFAVLGKYLGHGDDRETVRYATLLLGETVQVRSVTFAISVLLPHVTWPKKN